MKSLKNVSHPRDPYGTLMINPLLSTLGKSEARAVQARRGDVGPLAPDHLREAYRLYQQETGRVGAARPSRSKRLFVK